MEKLHFSRTALFCISTLTLVFLFLLSGQSLAEEVGSKSEDFFIPEVKFTPEIINQYVDEEGSLVTEYSDWPDEYTTDANGNIITEGTITPSSCAYRYSYKELSSTRIRTDSFISWHPHFPDWQKMDFYWFSNSSSSFSVGLSGFGVSVSVSVPGSGSGGGLIANKDYESRVAIFGDVHEVRREVTVTNPCGPNPPKYTQTIYRASKTYNRVVFK